MRTPPQNPQLNPPPPPQDEMAKVADAEGGSTVGLGKLSNVLMQMRKNCNHPDLITGPFSASTMYPVGAGGGTAVLGLVCEAARGAGRSCQHPARHAH